MKSEIETNKKEGCGFPCLMVSPSGDVVILATGKSDLGIEGMVVYSETILNNVGDSCKCWSDSFVPWTGRIILSNY